MKRCNAGYRRQAELRDHGCRIETFALGGKATTQAERRLLSMHQSILLGADVPSRTPVKEVETQTEGNHAMSFEEAAHDQEAFIQWAKGLRRAQGDAGHGTMGYDETAPIVPERVGEFVNLCWSTTAQRNGSRSTMGWWHCRS